MKYFIIIVTISYVLTSMSSNALEPSGCRYFDDRRNLPDGQGLYRVTVDPYLFIPGEIVTVNISRTDTDVFPVNAIQVTLRNQSEASSSFHWVATPPFGVVWCISGGNTLLGSHNFSSQSHSFSFIANIPEKEVVSIRALVGLGNNSEYLLSSSPQSISGSSSPQSISVSLACYPSPCQNGGTCFQSEDSLREYFCNCSTGFKGKNCSSETTDVCMCYTDANSQENKTEEGCIIDVSCDVDDILKKVSQVSIDEANIVQVSAALANVTGHPGIRADGIASVARVLENIVGIESPSIQVTQNVIVSVDNIMNVPDVSFSTNRSSSARILRAFESQLSFARDTIRMSLDNLAVEVWPSVSLANSLGFASKAEDDDIPVDDTLKNNVEKSFDGDGQRIPAFDGAEASILILPNEKAFMQDNTSVSVVFVVYANLILFQLPKSNDSNLRLNSLVISGSIGGKENQVTNLAPSVVTSFRPINNTGGQAVCVFWDPTLVVDNSAGNWSTEGCSLSEDNENGEAILCRCDHLTNFAILISYTGDEMYPVLDILSKIGCGISIAALILTIVVNAVVKNDLSSTPRKTLLNLCVSLILLYSVFLVGIELTQPRSACIVFAALIHYFFLSSVFWSSAEAMICFHLLVVTRKNLASGNLLRTMFLCWGIPAIIVSATLAVPYFIDGQVNVASDNYCFLSPGKPILFGVLLPVGALLLFNIFIYILVFRRLVCRRVESSRTRQETRAELVFRQARTMIPIGILLGGTWVFGFLAIGDLTATFQYIFAILNSLIGLAVFIFFVLMRRNARQGLKKLICCSSPKSAHSGGIQTTSNDGRSNNGHTDSTAM